MPSDPIEFGLLALLVVCGAVLYSSGGHAGASAYLAAMALFGVSAAVMKPTALMMNILVAAVGTMRFARAGLVPWSLLRPLCLGSVPAAFVGGSIGLPASTYLQLLGAVLWVAAVGLLIPRKQYPSRPLPASGWLVGIGAAMGLVAGLTGIGGGIFLSPLLLLTGWMDPRRTGGAAVVFILLNSILGLLGHASAARLIPAEGLVLGGLAMAGGVVGSWLGATKLPGHILRRVHAIILIVSGAKLLLGG